MPLTGCDVVNEKENAVVLTFKVVVPQGLTSVLDNIHKLSSVCVQEMLSDRTKSSSKFYSDRIPCVVAKSLITKYQRNKLCKRVTNLVLPICGDKGKQVKIESSGLRIPALFKKEIIPVLFPKPITGFIRQVEFFRQDKVWMMSYSYNSLKAEVNFSGVVGVDRNSVGNVAALADPDTGLVLRLGPDTASLKSNFRNRRGNLQSKGAKRVLKITKRKQSRRTKDINHKVSRVIVDYAKTHCKAVVLEDLGNIRKGKARRYVEKSQWSFAQLDGFIRYKAALLGVPVFYVDPRNTSKGCSRCGEINEVNGKQFKCSKCGHFDHRDANAAFNIVQRFDGQAMGNQKPVAGTIGGALTGEVSIC